MLLVTVIFAPYWCPGFAQPSFLEQSFRCSSFPSIHIWSKFSLCGSFILNPYLSGMTTAFLSLGKAVDCLGWELLNVLIEMFLFMCTYSKCFNSVLCAQNEKYLDYLKAAKVQNHTIPAPLHDSSEAYLLGSIPNSFISYMFSPWLSTDR